MGADVIKGLKGEEKAAILLMSMNKKLAADVLRHLNERDIQKITYQIANNVNVNPESKTSVLNEFSELCLAHGYISGGGLDYAKEVLTEALGSQKCVELLSKMSSFIMPKPFNFLKQVDTKEILNLLRYERNQTVALIMSYMDKEQAAAILPLLEEDRQTDIVKRIAKMDKISPDIVDKVEEEVKYKLNNFSVISSYTETVGVNIVADILSAVDRGTEKQIFDQLEEDNYEMAVDIRKRMFIFEDIIKLDKKSIQTVLSKVEHSELAMALKSTTDVVKDVIFENVSQRAREIIKEEIDMLGMVRLSDVHEAQQRIVAVILEMDRNQEIIITKSGGEKLVG